MQTANDDEEVMGQRTESFHTDVNVRACTSCPPWLITVANEIAELQVSVNSNNSSVDCKTVQPEMEIYDRKSKVTTYSSTDAAALHTAFYWTRETEDSPDSHLILECVDEVVLELRKVVRVDWFCVRCAHAQKSAVIPV